MRGRLIKRYKRFLADITLDSGEMITAHCANTGRMTGCAEPDARVYCQYHDNPKRKLKYSLELSSEGDVLVGVNTILPNRLVAEAINAGWMTPFQGYDTLKREVPFGEHSRVDVHLSSRNDRRPPCFVEVKNVTMAVDEIARFPDAISARGLKHLHELANQVRMGCRAAMVYVVQRGDCHAFGPAWEVDPVYSETLGKVVSAGVEVYAYQAQVSPTGIALETELPIRLNRP